MCALISKVLKTAFMNVAHKTILLLLSLLLVINSEIAKAQIPQGINYQAIARNAAGTMLSNQTVSLRFSIRNTSPNGAIEYAETQQATTNQFGLFTAKIGAGTVLSGNFSNINWVTGSKFLQVELDANAGTNFLDFGTTELLSVPFALYADKAGEAPAQTLSIAGAILSISRGNSVTLPNRSERCYRCYRRNGRYRKHRSYRCTRRSKCLGINRKCRNSSFN
jgi:hypothetical protein